MPLLKLEIEKLVPGGLGLARHNGEVLLASGVLPGEVVLAEPQTARGGVRRALVAEVLEPSPHRVEPDCHLAGCCGGCDFLQAAPETALALKGQAELGELAAQHRVELEFISSPLYNYYRSRATVHLDRQRDGSLGVGFYDHRRQLVEFESCRLLAPELNGLVQALRGWAGTLKGGGPGAEISLQKGEAGSGLSLHFKPLPAPRPGGRGRRVETPGLTPNFLKSLEQLPQELERSGWAEVAIWAQAGPKGRARHISGPKSRLPVALWPSLGLSLAASPGAFTQVNPAVNTLMVKKILELAAPLAANGQATALDLYSGLGNIGLPLLKSGFAVTLVEEAPDGVEAAKENGRGLVGLTIMGGRSEAAVANLMRQGRKFDLVTLDPPRAGALEMAPSVAALAPGLVIYVACHPAVLYRDLPAFASLGYGLRNLVALDMFPRTSHIEALAVLARR